MKYHVGHEILDDKGILDFIFQNLKPGKPETISSIFHNKNVKVEGARLHEAIHVMDALLTETKLVDAYKESPTQYYYTFKLNSKGILALRDNIKYSQYLSSKEAEKPEKSTTIEESKLEILKFLNSLPANAAPSHEQVMQHVRIEKDSYDTAIILLENLGQIFNSFTNIWIKPEGKSYLEELEKQNIQMVTEKNTPIKSEKHNLFSRWSNPEVVGTLITVGLILFGVGFYFGDLKADNKNVELRIDNKKLIEDNKILKDSVLFFRRGPTLQKPSNIPKGDTSAD